MKHKYILLLTLFLICLVIPVYADELIEVEYNPENIASSDAQVVVNTSTAEICLSDTQQCFPTLIGPTTPLGVYNLTLYTTHKKGYGGDILGFKIQGDFIFALHRVWLGKPSERRLERLRSATSADNHITNGCINVENEVYDLIKSRYYRTIKII